ncbi:hypothetical protein CWB99_04210 [Pseudoalteromonas rubra]|uniref:phosphoribosylglycinamide formyltransferase 1 n=1 Tax=Pseudoalteromonas rubra TaxID=43658 RepID=A0A5S3WR78_9GAMM|nr:formyltransferase family protein [Pseudoalteromonas rubra]TMP31465.1 hypothetical protein CWB99_04210 [Pseudoalteromonas rubra]TMP34549.1 hypothetical protein CWC00_07115 [Pseudoalteromonas rubra]
MNKVIFVGEGNSLKAQYIMELAHQSLNSHYQLMFFSSCSEGCAVTAAKRLDIEHHVTGKAICSTQVKSFTADCDDYILVLLGWPYIIKAREINALDGKLINCHGSYLPDYKGSRAYMHYWANIEEYYGITIHYVSEQVDAGNILAQSKLKLFPEETPKILHYRMCELIAHELPKSLKMVFLGDKGKPQTGSGRYFLKQDREFFHSIREHNEKNPSDKVLTPYK